MFNEDSLGVDVRKSPYSLKNPRNPYRGFQGFGEMTVLNPIGTDQVGTKLYTRKGELAGFDGGVGPAVPASSGFGGLGDFVSDALTTAKNLFGTAGFVLLLGTLAYWGYKKGWFEGLE